jgi:hypothetical protein
MPYKDKCFSSCKGFSKSECNPPVCKYNKGNTLEYCRLSHRYKMKRSKCNITRKYKKGELKKYAEKSIVRMIENSGKYLEKICSDSGVCIAFGKSNNEITRLFKGFKNFDYVSSDIIQIGGESSNGFVKELEYKKGNYISHAIIKSSQTYFSDNLIYEYLVGEKYVNRIVNKFPCFIQTYGSYYYNDEKSWSDMRNRNDLNKDILKGLSIQNTIDYSKACNKSKYAAILMQHLKNTKSMKHHISSSIYNNFIKNDLLFILFILYHALSSISKSFTHYDFHSENVLIYEPVKGKYFRYYYHHSDGSESVFNSPYLPKIIDYGRSFFDNGNVSSKSIKDKLCTIPACGKTCGENAGMAWLAREEDEYFITSSKKNESHDLRLANDIKIQISHIDKLHNDAPSEKSFFEVNKILKKIIYSVGTPRSSVYGTIENLNVDKREIYNVNGLYKELKRSINLDKIIYENSNRYNLHSNELGTLHIYEDGRPIMYEEA